MPASGRLYVADTRNNRVLSWPNAASLLTHAAADLVFGQGNDFTTNTANKGGTQREQLERPAGLAVDSQGNLYVADTMNNRILASITRRQRHGCRPRLRAAELHTNLEPIMAVWQMTIQPATVPTGVALDSSGTSYVADTDNNRLLNYNTPPGGTQ